MTEQSEKWEKQWHELLTHCHGEVNADKAFKADLLGKLKDRMSGMRAEDETSAENEHWHRLLTTAYVPCRPDSGFKTALFAKLREKQRDPESEDVIRSLLTTSYQPIEPRSEFGTRLLHNLKERQRNTRVLRRSTRRRTLFLSAASSLAAAAMVMFAVWVMPPTSASSSFHNIPARQTGFSLPLPEVAMRVDGAGAAPEPVSLAVPPAASIGTESATGVIPAAFEPESGYTTDYRVAAAFAGSALAASATALRNVDVDTAGGWTPAAAKSVALTPGTRFRASEGMGHMEFPDGALLSLSPDSLLEVTDDGLTVNRGFVLVAVPDSSTERFRLHFPERDIAVEPGTELAVMVEDSSLFAEGGAPAPMVMVVDRPGAGGLALARGENGVGPLFASQLYRLDRYVTPDLPGRTLCDAERQDLANLFKTETVRETLPMAAFAGGFAGGAGGSDLSYTATVLTPAGFSRQGDRWVADSYRNGPTVKLKYLSDEYFGFANERRDLARSLALGPNVILDAGNGDFYEIHR